MNVIARLHAKGDAFQGVANQVDASGYSELRKRAEARFDLKHFRNALGQFPTGVMVVTTRAADGRKVGLTANSFSSVSLDPPLVLWSLGKPAPSREDFVHASRFAITMLAHDQIDVSRAFATPAADKFASVAHVEGADRLPLIEGGTARLICRNVAQHDCGDHLIFVGEVDEYVFFDKQPLVFHKGQYRIVASHPALDKEQG